MSLADAVIGLKAYKEVDQRMEALWQGLNEILIRPRTSLEGGDPPAIRIENVRQLRYNLRTMLTYIVNSDVGWESRQDSAVSFPRYRNRSRVSFTAITRGAGRFLVKYYDA